MKVLAIGSVYPRFHEDAEVPWFRTSIAYLKNAGVEMQILAPAYKGLKSHEIDGVKVNRFRYAPASMEYLTGEEGAPNKIARHPLLQLLAIPYVFFGFFKCISICRKWRPDVIHVHWPFPHAFIALGASKLFKIPMAYTFYGAELLLIRKHKWVKPMLHFAIGQAKTVFSISEFTSSQINSIRKTDIKWSPYGTTLGTAPAKAASITDKFTILFVGRHIERKGIRYLIDAATKLPGDKFEIHIVGGGDLTEELKAYAQKTATENSAKVVFTGKISSEQLEEEYKNAGAFVLPAIVDSRGDTEGLGVVLIEAICLGVPVVASNVGGIPDVVIDGETGLLVEPKNPDALAEAFQKLQQNPELSKKLLEGGRKHVEKCFDWNGITERQIQAYKEML